MFQRFVATFSLVAVASICNAQLPPTYHRPGSQNEISTRQQSEVLSANVADLNAAISQYEVWAVESSTLEVQYKVEYFDSRTGKWGFLKGFSIDLNRAPDLLFSTQNDAEIAIARLLNHGAMRSYRIVEHWPVARWEYIDTFNDYDSAADFAWAIIHGTNGAFLAKVEKVNRLQTRLKND